MLRLPDCNMLFQLVLTKFIKSEPYVNLREGIDWYKSLPKHKTIIKDLDKIIQGFKTVSGLGL